MNLVESIKRHATVAVMGIVFSLIAVPAAHAASECKGMEQSACEAATDKCTWVDSYETKTGNKVKAYCRTKPGKPAPKPESK